METAALGFIRGGSSRHILISTKPISEASRRNRRGCWRLLPYLSVPKIEEMFNAGFGLRCLCMRCPAWDIRRATATTSTPRCLARSSAGTATALRRGSDIVSIRGLPTFMRAISTRRSRRALSGKFTCLRRGTVAPQAAEAMLDSCPLGSFQGLFLFNGSVGGSRFHQVLVRGTQIAVR